MFAPLGGDDNSAVSDDGSDDNDNDDGLPTNSDNDEGGSVLGEVSAFAETAGSSHRRCGSTR